MEDVPCTYRISVKAIIRNDDGVLLIRERGGVWELPGGGLEHGEDPRAGLAREITEETGYIIDWISESPVAFWTVKRQTESPNRLQWFGFVAYEARISGNFKPGSDTNDAAQEAKYYTVSNARTLTLHENTRPYFSEAMQSALS